MNLVSSATMKKALSFLATGTPIETDPSVLLFSGDTFGFTTAMDKYEEGRVGRALGDLQQKEIDAIMSDPEIPFREKQATIAEIKAKYIDVARNREGEEWTQAYQQATSLRALGNITSPLLGVGFKARTQVDLEIDDMYTQMNKLITMRDGMDSESYTQAWEDMREQFPFMDTVLLSRKGGELRDGAFSYNVRFSYSRKHSLIRIPKII